MNIFISNWCKDYHVKQKSLTLDKHYIFFHMDYKYEYT